MQRIALVFLLAVAAVSLTAKDATQAWFKLSPHLSKQVDNFSSKAGGLDVLIYLKNAADLSVAKTLNVKQDKAFYVVNALQSTAKTSQEGLVNYLDNIEAKYQRYFVANIVFAKNLKPHEILLVASRPDVKRIVANPLVKGLRGLERHGDDSAAPKRIEPGITYMKADKVWSELGVQGEGIVIAGQDTGIDFNHPAIKSQYRGNVKGEISHDYNWYDGIQESLEEAGSSNPCGFASSEPCDDNGHGTHTIGTIVGDDGEGNQIGVAPKAKWMGCRNMDNGYGRPSTYLACFQFFLAPFPVNGNPFTDGEASRAPHVMNNSWGCPPSEGCEGDEFVEVLENLKASGIMVVASAGNEGSGCSTIQDGPAHHSSTTFSIGAISSSSGRIANFSSRGPSGFDGAVGPDVVAPGVFVRSATPDGRYESFSGTSMAGPHAVGHVALLWSAAPHLRGDIEATAELTRSTATPRISTQACGDVQGSAHPNNVYGYGEINTYKAVQTALNR